MSNDIQGNCMTFQFKYEVQDYVRGYQTYAARGSRRWVTWFSWALGVFMLLMAISGSTGPKGNFVSALPAFLLAAVWFYFATSIWKRAARRAYRGRPELAQEFKVDIGDTGIFFDGPISAMRWTWPAFVRFTESKDLFLAYLSPCAFVILPKRMLGPGQTDQLRELLRQKLPAKRA
jgi:hypothetical protein